MKKEQLIKTIEGYDHRELLKEQYDAHNLSMEEFQILMDSETNERYSIPYSQGLTIEEFANKFEGDTLSIYYKDNKQVGFVRLGQGTLGGRPTRIPLRTIQNVCFNIEHPENGCISFNLNEYR